MRSPLLERALAALFGALLGSLVLGIVAFTFPWSPLFFVFPAGGAVLGAVRRDAGVKALAQIVGYIG